MCAAVVDILVEGRTVAVVADTVQLSRLACRTYTGFEAVEAVVNNLRTLTVAGRTTRMLAAHFRCKSLPQPQERRQGHQALRMTGLGTMRMLVVAGLRHNRTKAGCRY